MGIGADAGFFVGPTVSFGVNEFAMFHNRQRTAPDVPALQKAINVLVQFCCSLAVAEFIGQPFVDGDVGFNRIVGGCVRFGAAARTQHDDAGNQKQGGC